MKRNKVTVSILPVCSVTPLTPGSRTVLLTLRSAALSATESLFILKAAVSHREQYNSEGLET